MTSLLMSPSGDAAALKRWQALALGVGKAMVTRGKTAARPAFDAQPLDIAHWLEGLAPKTVSTAPYGGMATLQGSPVFMYPEWDWTFDGDNATASYTLSSGQHVTWTADAWGAWKYDDVTPGFDLGRTLNEIGSSLAVVAALSGFFVFVANFIHIAQAILNHEPISQLGAALKSDYDMLANRVALSESVMGYVEDPPSLLFAVQNGDWAKSWNQATNFGKDLSGITAAWAPGPAPDVNGKFTITAPKAAPPTFKLTAPSALTTAIEQNDATASQKLQSLLKGTPPMAGFNLVLVQPKPGETAAQAQAQSLALTAAMNAIKTQSPAELAGVKAPVPTASNPQGGRTILGLPALDVGMGAVAAIGLGIVAKVKGWF